MEDRCEELKRQSEDAKRDYDKAVVTWALKDNLKGCEEETTCHKAEQVYLRKLGEYNNCKAEGKQS